METYKVVLDRKPSAIGLKNLFDQEGWSKGRSLDSIEALLNTLHNFVAVFDGDDLVGFGRAVSDGQYRALIDDVIVDSKHRGRGIGKEIMRSMEYQLKNIDEVFLNTSTELKEFYGAFGYRKFDGLTMFKQK